MINSLGPLHFLRRKSTLQKPINWFFALVILLCPISLIRAEVTVVAKVDGVSQTSFTPSEELPNSLSIIQASVGEWEYGVYILGLPLGLKARLKIFATGNKIKASSAVDHFLLANNHTSSYSLKNCQYVPERYNNSGFSPGWRFDDSVIFDRGKKEIRYRGMTQRPNAPDAEIQTITLPLDGAIYVDKLSQFAALACAIESDAKEITLSYVDDTIGRYKFTINRKVKEVWVGGRKLETISVHSEPYSFEENSIHNPVSYLLAPALGYLPVKVSTKLKGMRLSVKLLRVAK